MKLAIKVITEWDRENVILFFEKHYPKCNETMGWRLDYIRIGNLLWVDEDNDLRNNNVNIPSDYTILQGVPQNMELPKVEPTKSREQELEECLSDYITLSSLYGSTSESNYTIQLDNLTDKAKQLLNNHNQ